MESLGWDIAETAHALRRAFDRAAAELGVTRSQWRVLGRLTRTPGLRQVDLADQMDIEPITLCRIVDRLEEAKLLERQRDPADRRAWRLYLTEAATPLCEKLQIIADRLSGEVFSNLTASQLATFTAALGTIRANVDALDQISPPKGVKVIA